MRNALAITLLALACDLAYAQITIDITPRVPTKEAIQRVDRQTGKTFVQRQRKHAKPLMDTVSDVVKLVGKRAKVITNVPAADSLNVYTAPLVVGSGAGAQSYNLLIDTGSSFTWVGSGSAYVQTSDARDQNRTFSIAYGSGTASGEYWKANCHFQGVSGTTMNAQGFGVASQSNGFGNVDGILGLGPTALSAGTVDGLGTIPTVVDTLKKQNRIPNAIVAASFAPNTKGTTAVRGSLTLGGVDSSKFKSGSLVYNPKLADNSYWGALVNRFTYTTTSGASSNLGAVSPRGIVDTGTTLLLLPQAAFAAYLAAIPGAYIASDTGLTMVPRASYPKIGNLTIFWNKKPFTLISDAQLMPPALGQLFEASNPNNDFVSIVASSGSDEYTIGMLALTRFYSVFDTPNKRIGLAYTQNTFDRTSGIKIPLSSSSKKPSTKTSSSKKCNGTSKDKQKHKRAALTIETALAHHRRSKRVAF